MKMICVKVEGGQNTMRDGASELVVVTHTPLEVGQEYILEIKGGRVVFDDPEVKPLMLPHEGSV